MADTPQQIKAAMDIYLNDNVPDKSIDASELNTTLSKILENLEVVREVTTTQRLTLDTNEIKRVIDTDLGYIVYYFNGAWRNFTGATVD